MENTIRLHGTMVHLCSVRNDEEAVGKYLTWINDESILQYLASNYKVMSYPMEKKWAEKESTPYEHRFNIVTADTDELIGTCSAKADERCLNVTVGILIGEAKYRNKGYGTEAMSLLVKYAFNQLRTHRVELSLNSENIRALKCYQKCGFVECAREHEAIFADGRYIDRLRMEILEQDYRKNIVEKEEIRIIGEHGTL